ncbi:MAG: hypothetical protein V7L23_34865 [Nostoc sp.]
MGIFAHHISSELAQSAASIVANDDPSKPDLGRTTEDQQIIQETLPYLQNETWDSTVKNKVPKTLRDLKKADRLTSYSEQELIAGLKELIQFEKLNTGENNTYFLPDW